MATAVTAPPRSSAETPRPDGTHRRWVVPVCTGVVLLLYAVSAVAVARDGSASGSDFHRRQAAAIADGHLDIRPVPDELAELEDPYDAAANLRVRVDGGVQDLAYRDGRLYSAHGLTVPLLLMPAQLATGSAPPNWVITLVAGSVGAVAAAWILSQGRRRFVPDLPDWATATTVLAVGLCGPVWALMSVGNGYEAATATAFALTMVGAGLLLASTDALPVLRRGHAALGSACLALAVGARPTAIVTGVLVAVVAVVAGRATATSGASRRRPVDLVAVVGPFVVVGGLVAASNLVRFGSPVEFGFGYQLSVWNMTEYPKGRLSYLGPNLVDYALALPRTSGSFPWIGLRRTVGGDSPSMHTSEPLVGLLFSAPVLLVGALCAVTAGRRLRAHCHGLWVAVSTAAATGLLGLVAVSLPFNTSSFRYAADGAPLLLLAACGLWAWARQSATEDRRVLDGLWMAALVVGIAVTAAVQVPT